MEGDSARRKPERRWEVSCARYACAAIVSAFCALSAAAQERDDLFQQQRLIDRRLDAQRKDLAPLESRLNFTFGGWAEYYVANYSDGVQESRTLNRIGGSFWLRGNFEDTHEFFARVKLRYTSYGEGDEIDQRYDLWGPNFDEAWYQIDIFRALYMGAKDDTISAKVRAGRQPVIFGTGYGLDMPLDAVLIDLKLADFKLMGLLGKSIPSFPNVDTSGPVDSHSYRRFYGMQVDYDGWQHHVPFVYALWQDDATDERPQDYSQNYAYDSFYFAMGSRGEIIKDLNYFAEGIYETGRSYGDGDFLHQDTIDAWGADIGIEQKFKIPTSPRLIGEYMYASGDPDRIGSPTNAAGGNRRDDIDTSFVGFGLRDTGISLAPIPSNLHIFKAGGSLRPLEKVEFFRNFELGTNWFLYYKASSSGAITDPLADMYASYVGWEMDYYFNWRLSSDVSWTVRWGEFFPGDAYSDDDPRHFVFSGVVWSF